MHGTISGNLDVTDSFCIQVLLHLALCGSGVRSEVARQLGQMTESETDMGGSTEELSVRLDVVDVICPGYDVDRGSRALRRSSEVIPSLLKHSN